MVKTRRVQLKKIAIKEWMPASRTLKGGSKGKHLIFLPVNSMYVVISTLLMEIPARYQGQIKVFSWSVPTNAHVEERFGLEPEAFSSYLYYWYW